MTIEIVPSTEDNAKVLSELMAGYFSFYELDPNEKIITSLIHKLREDSDNNKQFLARFEGKYIGFITLYEIYSTLTGGKVILMNDLFVQSGLRGKGIGQALFKFGVEYTKKLGYPKMEWVTEPNNTQARRFYDKLGGKSSQWIYYALKMEAQ